MMAKFFKRMVILALVFGILFAVPVSAISAETLGEYADTGIWFYQPNNCEHNRTVPSSPSAAATAGIGGLSGLQVSFVEQYHELARVLSINYGIPWEAVMAQGILESTSGTSNFARERNNFFGIGAIDSNPNLAYRYATPEEGWKGYYEFIRVNSLYREHGVFSGETVTDPMAYIVAIKEAGYATDADYVSELRPIVSGIEALSVARGWESSAVLASRYPQWRENARRNSAGAGSINAVQMISVCDDGVLVSGGMTLEQAQAFMTSYIELARRYSNSRAVIEGADFPSLCTDGPLANCSAFSRWFVVKYTTYGDPGQYNGRDVVRELGNRGIPTGRIPRVYAVFSKTTGTYGHTGVVLGINEENDEIIIGEANCGQGIGGIHAVRRSLRVFQQPQYSYAYLDGILRGF